MLKKTIPFIVMTLIAIFVYREGVLGSDKILVAHDYNTSSVVWRQMGSQDSQLGGVWYRDYMAGWADQVLPYNVFWLTIKAFDPFASHTMVYFLGTLLVGFFFYLFMRSTGLSMMASLFGGVSLMLSNHFLTVLLPGHASKFMTFIWIPLVFLFLRKAVRENRWTHYLYSGFFLGLALQGQFYEVVLFFGVMAFFYWLYLIAIKRSQSIALGAWLKSEAKNILRHTIGLSLVVGMMLLLALQLFPTMFNLATGTTAQELSSDQKWDFATSWSLPPEEIIELVVPGVFGFKSGDQDSPYWGRMGKPSVPSGLKLNAENVGIIPLILALFAGCLLFKKRESEARFWLLVLIGSLIFAFGRHIPILYGPFYHLPFMDSIRNPNKILWLTMFAVSFLAALGFELMFKPASRKENLTKLSRASGIVTTAFGGLSILALALAPSLRPLLLERLGAHAGIQQALDYIPLAFLLTTGFSFLLWLSCWKLDSWSERYPWLAGLLASGLILFTGLDLWLSGRHYVEYQDRKTSLDYQGSPAAIVKNGQLAGVGFNQVSDPVVSWLKTHTQNGEGRVFVDLNGITDYYSRHLFPFHGIPCVNFNPNPRLPRRYADFSRATGYQPYQYSQPAADQLSVRFRLSLEPGQTTNHDWPVRATYPLNTYPQPYPTGLVFRIYENPNYRPQAWMAEAVLGLERENQIKALAGLKPEARFLALTEPGVLTSLAQNVANPDFAGYLTNELNPVFLEYGQNRVKLRVKTQAPGLLVLNDAWHEGWVARVNDQAVPIHPVNLLFRGVEVPAGESLVEMEYRPWPELHYASLAGYGLVLVVALWDFVTRRRRKSGDA